MNAGSRSDCSGKVYETPVKCPVYNNKHTDFTYVTMLTNSHPMGARNFIFAFTSVLILALLFPTQETIAQSDDDEPSEQEILTHYSLYTEDWRNENYERAEENLRWILEHAPIEPRNDDRNFRRAVVDVYPNLAEEAESEEERKEHLETAYATIQEAWDVLEATGADYDEFRWLIREGSFLEQYGDELDGVGNHYTDLYRQAFEKDAERIDPYFIERIIERDLEQGDQEAALAFMDEVEAHRSGDDDVMQLVSSQREDVFGANPAARLEYHEEKLANNPDDLDLMMELFDLYLEQGQRSSAVELSERIIEQDPPMEAYREIAEMRLDDGLHEEAYGLYQRALDEDAEPRAEDYYNMGRAQRQLDNFQQSREYYRQALEIDAEFGRAYAAIGDLYVRTVSECSDGELDRDDRAVYWLAVDMYERAMEVDDDVASTAQSQIRTYQQYLPTVQDIFYRSDWTEGESIQIDYGCYSWINESTVVRSP